MEFRLMKPVFSVFVACLVLPAVIGTVGCQYFYDRTGEAKMIPCPLPDAFPYEVSGQLYRVWVGNEIQIQDGKYTSYLILQGVNNPDSGDEREEQAINHLYKLIGAGEIRAVVHEHDTLQRCIAQIFVGDTNLNLKMVADGWGQYDGSEFATAQQYTDAQEQARNNRIGIWAR